MKKLITLLSVIQGICCFPVDFNQSPQFNITSNNIASFDDNYNQILYVIKQNADEFDVFIKHHKKKTKRYKAKKKALNSQINRSKGNRNASLKRKKQILKKKYKKYIKSYDYSIKQANAHAATLKNQQNYLIFYYLIGKNYPSLVNLPNLLGAAPYDVGNNAINCAVNTINNGINEVRRSIVPIIRNQRTVLVDSLNETMNIAREAHRIADIAINDMKQLNPDLNIDQFKNGNFLQNLELNRNALLNNFNTIDTFFDRNPITQHGIDSYRDMINDNLREINGFSESTRNAMNQICNSINAHKNTLEQNLQNYFQRIIEIQRNSQQETMTILRQAQDYFNRAFQI